MEVGEDEKKKRKKKMRTGVQDSRAQGHSLEHRGWDAARHQSAFAGLLLRALRARGAWVHGGQEAARVALRRRGSLCGGRPRAAARARRLALSAMWSASGAREAVEAVEAAPGGAPSRRCGVANSVVKACDNAASGKGRMSGNFGPQS